MYEVQRRQGLGCSKKEGTSFKNQLTQGPNRKKTGPLGEDLQKLGTSWLWSCTNVFGVTANLGSFSHTGLLFSLFRHEQ